MITREVVTKTNKKTEISSFKKAQTDRDIKKIDIPSTILFLSISQLASTYCTKSKS